MSGTEKRARRNRISKVPILNKVVTDMAYWLQDVAFRVMVKVLRRLPYEKRVPLCGRIMSSVIAPLAGYRRRIRDNLALVMPQMPPAEVARLVRQVPDNVGRTLIEMYSGKEFVARAKANPLQGPGLAALAEAKVAGRPVILVTGHFGNYDASRAALIAAGYRVGGLYRPMKNPYFNAHYVRAIERIGKPLFPRGKAGLTAMVHYLRKGGMLGILIDQHMGHGARLTFFGREASTALSAAELALRYNALVIPTYAVRRENGLDFDIIIEAPIPEDAPEIMTQALNDSLEAIVRQHPEQWFWIHRRWK